MKNIWRILCWPVHIAAIVILLVMDFKIWQAILFVYYVNEWISWKTNLGWKDLIYNF